jgi:folate-binding protein YgfZ
VTSPLESAGGAVVHPDAFEFFRIERGVPAFGRDITERTIPLESNLRDALDLGKGCFPGQEFLARINNLGHPARVLARLRFDGASPAVGDAVKDSHRFSAAEGGTITSVGRVEGGQGLAFATLPWKLRGSGQLEIVSAGGPVRAAAELVGEYPDATERRPTP